MYYNAIFTIVVVDHFVFPIFRHYYYFTATNIYKKKQKLFYHISIDLKNQIK